MIDARHVHNIGAAYRIVRQRLLAERTPDGYWLGHLSSSALATATAVSALTLADPARHAALIRAGVGWLADHQNDDGGWGDTPDSPSNLATTLLGQAALHIADNRDGPRTRDRAEAWLARHAGPAPDNRIAALRRAYGDDRTFAVPILTNCALAGTVQWADVPALPFELARIPHRWLRLFRAHVVSYALPALVAIGQLLHQKRPARFALLRAIRNRSIAPTLRKLQVIQPSTGGFIEAVPLTSFVVMSLAAAGRPDHPVAVSGAAFLERSARPDGSWPIDSNLSVWLTTQAVTALAAGPDAPPADLPRTIDWIAARQHAVVHPFTHAAPGGWGWTHLDGGVPDADDTAGALLALSTAHGDRAAPAAEAGIRWLLDLQNPDGGWPAFCRGWGRLPFDRSAPDLTAHALRALAAWAPRLGGKRLAPAVDRGFRYLAAAQGRDGSWQPLWFGNQAVSGGANPVFGTARVLAAYRDTGRGHLPQARRGLAFLMNVQNNDGGWGGAGGVPPTIEETAAVVDSAAGWLHQPDIQPSCLRGALYLAERIPAGAIDNPTPIGLYFTKLWYAEKLYPLIWSLAALGRVLGCLRDATGDRANPAASGGAP